MNRIVYGEYTFDDEQIVDGSVYEPASLLSDVLEIGTLTVELLITEDVIGRRLMDFRRNTPVFYFRDGQKRGTWYVDQISRTGRDTYELRATDAIGLLEQSFHKGGIYTGQTVQEVLEDICTVPYVCKSGYLEVKLYGWLPYAKRRENLAQVLFTLGAAAKTDLNGCLRFEPLYGGPVARISENSIFFGDKVRTESRITAVSVLEHQFVPGTEEVELFSGVAQEGDLITFREPMHSLTAENLTIREAGANYAILAAGNGRLTGKSYIHNTRAVRRTVSSSEVANEVEVQRATLVSMVNVANIADRLAAYYRHVETVENRVILGRESAGDVVLLDHPYGGVQPGTVKSIDTTMGAQRATAEETLLMGYAPQPERGYVNRRIILTGSGTFRKPGPEVKNVQYVLISGADGGEFGGTGQDGRAQSISYVDRLEGFYTMDYSGHGPGKGGEGGEGGHGGAGGRIVKGELDLSQLETVPYACGKGGLGAATAEETGSRGTETTFGSISTALGTSSPLGYTDTVTGEVFGAQGLTGIPGGSGGSYDGQHTDSENIGKWTPGSTVIDEDGRTWEPGPTQILDGGGLKGRGDSKSVGGSSITRVGVQVSVGLGAGAAGGSDGSAVSTEWLECKEDTQKKTMTAHAVGSDGANGANAVLVPHKAVNGNGGRGGYGGGGGAAPGYSLAGRTRYTAPGWSLDVGERPGKPGLGGRGAAGGEGADGLIILYYAEPLPESGGALTDRSGRLLLDRTGRLMVV